MKIDARIESGKLTIDVWELLATATGDERAALIDALACQGEIIDEVANQIIDGFTSLASHAARGYGSTETYGGLDHAIRRVAEASGDIAAKEIAALKASLRRTEARINEGWKAYHELLESTRGSFR